MNKSTTATNTATVCDKLTIVAVNHISMLIQYVLNSLFRSRQARSLVAEWAETLGSHSRLATFFVVGSNPAIGLVIFFL